ncbi:MAG: phospholipase [Alphaproteobacteria bacterium]|nr:phospholipase [Alphaproteobacteria bacterium]
MSLDGAVAPLLDALTRMLAAQRHLHPIHLEQLKLTVGDAEAPLQAVFDAFPESGSPVDDGVRTSMDLTLKALSAFREVPQDPEGIFQAYRALRYAPYAMETLYPAASESPAVSDFFLEEARQGDAAFAERLAAPQPNTGVFHVENERGSKGGYSFYVPEYYDPAETYPVVVALHGGAGHGRGFLWTWLKEARSRGIILISPTARGDTWALMGPDIDSENLEAILEDVRARWSINEERMLLTGMSDGGTFTYVSGLRAASPFSHLAPIAASFHPMMPELIDNPKIAGRPIYLTHGTHDWMFDVEVAHLANQILGSMGADITFREISDLAHTYPRDENPRILGWFLGT